MTNDNSYSAHTVSQQNKSNSPTSKQKLEEFVYSPVIQKGDFLFHFTKDETLLQQYYKLRGDMYARELGLDDFPRTKDRFDDLSDILVLEKKGEVIGGVRITMKKPHSDILLPMESNDYNLNNLLPEMNLENFVYGEFSRLAVLPGFRTEHVKTIIGMVGNKGRELSAKYLFAIAPSTQARMYRKFEKYFGFTLEVRKDLGQSQVAKKWGLNMPLLIFREDTSSGDAEKTG